MLGDQFGWEIKVEVIDREIGDGGSRGGLGHVVQAGPAWS
jgi:hypothetical protein